MVVHYFSNYPLAQYICRHRQQPVYGRGVCKAHFSRAAHTLRFGVSDKSDKSDKSVSKNGYACLRAGFKRAVAKLKSPIQKRLKDPSETTRGA